MPSPSKAKGNRFEREIVNILTEQGLKAKRAWGSNGQALGFHEEVDVLIDSYIRVQAKVRKAMGAWMLPSEDVDLQVIKRDRGETLVVMRFDDWLNDYRRLMELEGRL